MCNKEMDKEVILASDEYHVAGKWRVTKEPTVSESGTETLFCAECQKSMDSRSIQKLPAYNNNQSGSLNDKERSSSTGSVVIVVIVSIAVVALVSVLGVFSRKKKNK